MTKENISDNHLAATKISDDPIAVRQAKRKALIDEGKNPYGHAFQISAHINDINEKYIDLEDGEILQDRVDIAGRLMAKRNQGKIIFSELQDFTGRIQLFCRINTLGENAFLEFKDLDVGDWIGVSGTIMKTRRGQLTVAVDHFDLLSKSLRPLPEKFHGLNDKETRYRQRYVDLIVNDEVKQTFIKRSQIISAIREYMNAQGFFEVETPMLQPILGGANARPFVTHHNTLDRDYYLRIATELHLKRLLVGGFEKVYEIGRQFRNEGMDPFHNPEFTTMEAYQAFSDLFGMMSLTQGFIQAAAQRACGTLKIIYGDNLIDLSGNWKRASMIELIEEQIDQKISFEMNREELVGIASRYDVSIEPTWDKGKIISEIFEATVEEKLIQPTFVLEHPIEISPLAKRCEANPNVADRFELFICGHEFANAFNELNDPVDQAQRFLAQLEAKDNGDEEAMGFDADYIRALEYGMPPAGGVGLGIDRLTMLLTNSASIRDVLLFPHMREETM